jgi:hypothetical protein
LRRCMPRWWRRPSHRRRQRLVALSMWCARAWARRMRTGTVPLCANNRHAEFALA